MTHDTGDSAKAHRPSAGARELALAIIHATKGDPVRVTEAATLIDLLVACERAALREIETLLSSLPDTIPEPGDLYRALEIARARLAKGDDGDTR